MKSLKSLKSKANSALLLIFSSSLFADPSSGSDYNMPVGVTEVSQSIFDLHMVIFWICVWIGVVVFGVMFFSLWKYRKSRGAVPAKFHDNFALEILSKIEFQIVTDHGQLNVVKEIRLLTAFCAIVATETLMNLANAGDF